MSLQRFYVARRLLAILFLTITVVGCEESTEIVISRETTYITAPLGEDGLPDYLEYLRQKHRVGVTPENNAVVLLTQATGLDLPEELHESWYEQLGIDPLPEEGNYYVPTNDEQFVETGGSWLIENRHEEEEEASEAFEELVGSAMERPWTSEQIPPLAEWLKQNEESLNLACEASRRPRFFMPCVTTEEPAVISLLLPTYQQIRGIVRGLSIRAMWHLGEQRYHKAQQDILALHRLARLSTQTSFCLVQCLVGIAIDGRACHAHLALLTNANVPLEILQTSFTELKKLPRWQMMIQAIDQGERFMALDAAMLMAQNVNATAGVEELLGSCDASVDWIIQRGVDWNIVLLQLNDTFDQLVTALQIEDRNEREDTFEAIVDAAVVDAELLRKQIWQLVFSRHLRSQWFASTLESLLIPAANAAMIAEERANMQLDLTIVAVALALHQREQGDYPEQLSDLVPQYLTEVPSDLFTGQPLHYELRGDGYLLYSCYDDGEDNGGDDLSGDIIDGEWVEDNDSDEADGEDLVIRIPMPVLNPSP